jgi:hypothetical protein
MKKGQPVNARLVAHDVKGYPMIGVRDTVPLGTVYAMYPETVTTLEWGDQRYPELRVKLPTVWVERAGDAPFDGYMPLELLETMS